MRQIIGDLSGHQQFTVGFLDTSRRHFGAASHGMLAPGAAAGLATQAVQQHRTDIFAGLQQFVSGVKREASGQSGTVQGSGGGDAGTSGSGSALPAVLIVIGVLAVLGLLGFLLIVRPIRRRRQQELKDAKTAAQDDLIALSNAVTSHDTDAAIQNHPEAAAEQGAALTAYERGTAALDAARNVKDMRAVSRAIAEGQYHLAAATALANGEPRPARRPACFFDPRHGMSVRDVEWVPPDGGPSRAVPACAADAHKVEQGIDPGMRQVEAGGRRVDYASAGFAPAYWGGFGFLPSMFTGFLLGEALGSFGGFPGWYGDYDGGFGDGDYGDGGYGGGDFGDGGYGGGDFGDGDYGGGDFGGGDFGGGDFGGGDFGGGGDFS
jgi:type II secretory pathway pseudopilin PulG